MKFILVIGKNALYTYEKNGQQVQVQYVEGSDRYPFSSSSIGEDVKTYMNALANERNLGTTGALEFDVLESPDSVANSAIMSALGDNVGKKYNLFDALETVIKKLSRDKKLMIDRYGINYEGFSYKKGKGSVEQSNYDLLSYTVHADDVISLVDI